MSWYRMKRGWMENDFFKKEPFTERDAWMWMIEEAQWKGGPVNILGKPIVLQRGQFSDSIRFMSLKFQWSKSKVEHFLERLKKWDMIRTENRTGQLIITICNYSKHQDKQDTQQDSNRTASETRTGHEQDKQEEGKEGKEGKELKKRKARPAKRPENVSEEIWEDYTGQRKAVFTKTALAGIEREVAKAGMTLEEGLRVATERGWQSFKADWVKKGKINGHTKSEQLDDILGEYLADKGIPHPGGNGANSPDNSAVIRSIQHVRQGPAESQEPSAGVRAGIAALSRP